MIRFTPLKDHSGCKTEDDEFLQEISQGAVEVWRWEKMVAWSVVAEVVVVVIEVEEEAEEEWSHTTLPLACPPFILNCFCIILRLALILWCICSWGFKTNKNTFWMLVLSEPFFIFYKKLQTWVKLGDLIGWVSCLSSEYRQKSMAC